jgi:hypothetical protein
VKLYVESDPEKRVQNHWMLAISALDKGVHGGGTYAHARRAMHHALDVGRAIPLADIAHCSRVGAGFATKTARLHIAGTEGQYDLSVMVARFLCAAD